MDIFSCVKCVSCLCGVIKVIKMLKKAFCCILISVMIIIAAAGMLENRGEIEKAFKKLKKKVM